MEFYKSTPFTIAILVFLCSFLVTCEAQLKHDELTALKFQIGKQCNSAGLSDDEIKQAFAFESVTDAGKCLLTCTLKKLGVLTEDGKWSREGTKNFGDKIQGEPSSTDEKRLGDIFVQDCDHIQGTDECDFGYKLFACGHELYTKFQLP